MSAPPAGRPAHARTGRTNRAGRAKDSPAVDAPLMRRRRSVCRAFPVSQRKDGAIARPRCSSLTGGGYKRSGLRRQEDGRAGSASALASHAGSQPRFEKEISGRARECFSGMPMLSEPQRRTSRFSARGCRPQVCGGDNARDLKVSRRSYEPGAASVSSVLCAGPRAGRFSSSVPELL